MVERHLSIELLVATTAKPSPLMITHNAKITHDAKIMRYAGCHSERIPVIPSVARNLIKSSCGCRMRFFTPLRSVQNDMTEDGLSEDPLQC